MQIQLVVARADQINVLLREDVEVVFAFRIRSVIKPVALDAVAGVNEEEIDAFIVGLLARMLRE